jgi:hypothetical protein
LRDGALSLFVSLTPPLAAAALGLLGAVVALRKTRDFVPVRY